MQKSYLLLLALILGTAPSLFAQWDLLRDEVVPSDYNPWCLKVAPDGSIWATATYYDPEWYLPKDGYAAVMRSTDGGQTWHTHFIEEVGPIYIGDVFPFDSLTAFAALEMLSGLYFTEDGGQTWTEVESYEHGPFFVHFFNKDDGWVLGFENQPPFRQIISVTADGGATWTHIGGSDWTGPPGTSLPDPILDDYFGFTHSQSSMYGISGETIIFGKTKGTLWMSHDKGYNWTRMETPLAALGIATISVAIKDPMTFTVAGDFSSSFAPVPTKCFSTTDGGLTWTEGDPSVATGALKYLPGNDNVLLMMGSIDYGGGNPLGSAVSLNHGADWTTISDIPLGTIDVGPDGQIIASGPNFGNAEQSGGMYALNFEPSNTREALPLAKDLRITPNPFSVSTLVEFELLDHTRAVDLIVSDLFGRRLQTFHFANPAAGLNQVPLQLEGPAGILLLTLQQGDAVQTARLVKQ
jgi:hypothetical protein